MSTGVGVVVPAYRPVVDRLVAYLRRLDATLSPATLRVELDDPDGTVAPALRERSLPASASVAAVACRRGKGAAVTAGFEALSTPVRAFADADGATPAESIEDVVATVRDGSADLAVGSRRHSEADVVGHQTVIRRFLGNGFAWLARRLLDAELFDYQCGAKAISAECWRAVRDHLYEPGFAWDIELVAVAAAVGSRVAEVPVAWEDKPGSTVDPVGDAVEMLRGLVAARHRAKLLADDPVHEFVAGGRDAEPTLVDRLAVEANE
ncbi:MAG: glycosyltransferase [Halolamina sp.]